MIKKPYPRYSEFSYPELRMADKTLERMPKVNGRIITNPGDSLKAFGPERLKDPKFKKELDRLQQKHNVSMLA